VALRRVVMVVGVGSGMVIDGKHEIERETRKISVSLWEKILIR
jgi:hypothetical protein